MAYDEANELVAEWLLGGRMLARVTATEAMRQSETSLTKPVLMRCETSKGTSLEIHCKFSAGCHDGQKSLAREVVAACLAADLGLPVPDPYLVEVPTELASTVVDPDIAGLLQASSPVAFGSTDVGNQFHTWTSGNKVSDAMMPVALGTFVFDAVIDNRDRRIPNPNCLVAGDRVHLIDHELGFPPIAERAADWKPPWEPDSLRRLRNGDHIFYRHLRKRPLDFSPLEAAWSKVTDRRLMEYREAIPSEWATALPAVAEALDQIRSVRDNFSGVIAEIRRVLQ